MNAKTKCVIYCRVSSKEQEETGYSLPAQQKLLEEYASRKGFDIAKVFSMSESASGAKQRKVFDEMMTYLEKHNIPHLLCEKVDRLTRNLKDAVTVNDWVEGNDNRQIHFVKQNLVIHKNAKSDEKFRWDIEIVLAKKYIANLSEEVRKGQAQKLYEGWLPTKPPLGYKTIGEKGHKIHVIDEDKKLLVLKMFELYATGNYSLKKLVETMFREGLRSENGRKIIKSRLHELLRNVFYIGINRWKEVDFPGKHECFISKGLFELVQQHIKRQYSNPQYKKHLPTFKAKIHCQDCNGTITWYEKKHHWYGQHNNYNECSQREHGCIRQERVEELLLPYMDKVAPANDDILAWLTKAMKEDQQGEIEAHNSQLQALERVVRDAERRLEGAYRDKLDGKMPSELCAKIIDESTKEKEQALESLSRLNKTRKVYYDSGIALHELALRARAIYANEKVDVEHKRLLLSYVFENIGLKEKDLSVHYTSAFKFLAEWMPKVNENFELAQSLTKNEALAGVPNITLLAIGSKESESENKFRTSKTSDATPRFEDFSSNHDVCSAARTRTWNHRLNRAPLYH